MKVNNSMQSTQLSRRVWTIHQRGRIMKFEVALANHAKLMEAIETMRHLTSQCPDYKVFERDE